MSAVCHLLAQRSGEPDLQEGLGGGGGVHLGLQRQRDQNPSQPHKSLNERLQHPWGGWEKSHLEPCLRSKTAARRGQQGGRTQEPCPSDGKTGKAAPNDLPEE